MNMRDFESPGTLSQISFISNLLADFKRLEYSTEFVYSGNCYSIKVKNKNGDTYSLSTRGIRRNIGILSQKRIEDSYEIINKCKDMCIENFFTDGSELDIDKINPKIVFIKRPTIDYRHLSIEEKKYNELMISLFEYCRLLQNIPNSDPPFRILKSVILDIGQKNPKVIGVLCVSSTSYFSKLRDDYLEWSKHDSRSKTRIIREFGLRRIVQLSLCFAVDPYRQLLFNKYLCSLVFCNEFQDEYYRRYGNYYYAVVATSAIKPENRLYIGIDFSGFSAKFETSAYKYLGFIDNEGSFLFSDRTIESGRMLLNYSRYKYLIHKRINRKAILAKALSLCNLSSEIINIHRLGMYIGYISSRNFKYLVFGKDGDFDVVNSRDVYIMWRSQYLPSIFIDERKYNEFLEFKKEHNYLWRVNL